MLSDEEILQEAAATAFRERSPHGDVQPHHAWLDLDEEGRARAFAQALKLRQLEAALDPEGQSSTVKAVLARLQKPSEEP
jgi:hypothetical protein